MAEGHLETFGHGEAAEAVERFYSDQIPQWWLVISDWSSPQRLGGERGSPGAQEVNSDMNCPSCWFP